MQVYNEKEKMGPEKKSTVGEKNRNRKSDAESCSWLVLKERLLL